MNYLILYLHRLIVTILYYNSLLAVMIVYDAHMFDEFFLEMPNVMKGKSLPPSPPFCANANFLVI